MQFCFDKIRFGGNHPSEENPKLPIWHNAYCVCSANHRRYFITSSNIGGIACRSSSYWAYTSIPRTAHLHFRTLSESGLAKAQQAIQNDIRNNSIFLAFFGRLRNRGWQYTMIASGHLIHKYSCYHENSWNHGAGGAETEKRNTSLIMHQQERANGYKCLSAAAPVIPVHMVTLLNFTPLPKTFLRPWASESLGWINWLAEVMVGSACWIQADMNPMWGHKLGERARELPSWRSRINNSIFIITWWTAREVWLSIRELICSLDCR